MSKDVQHHIRLTPEIDKIVKAVKKKYHHKSYNEAISLIIVEYKVQKDKDKT